MHPENCKLFKGMSLWIRSAHQICAEHWISILNECMNGEMSKTAWRRANGISEKSSSTGRGSCTGTHLRVPRLHRYRQLSDSIKNWWQHLRGKSPLPRSDFYPFLRTQLRIFIRILWSERAVSSWRPRIPLRMDFSLGSEGSWVLNNAAWFR